MNHQPFETWLLSGEPLASDQAQALRDHLLVCEACQQLRSSWSEVQRLFEEAPVVLPERGFTQRWHDRLKESRRIHQRKQTRAFLAASASAALILFIFIAIRLIEVIRSPEQFLLVWIYRVVSALALINEAQVIVKAAFSIVTSIVPLPVWIGLILLLAILGGLWLVLYKTITTQRRIEA